MLGAKRNEPKTRGRNVVEFKDVPGGTIGMVCEAANVCAQPAHVQVRRTGNDGPVPDVAVSLDGDGVIVIQIRVGVTATIACRDDVK